MTTTKKEAHAITNARGHLESIKEDYRNYKEAEKNDDYKTQDETRESILDSVLSVQFRSGWHSSLDDDIVPEEFKILLSWGGPACQIIGKLDQYKQPTDIEIQYQDWGTPWTTLEISCHHDDYQALDWFCNCFYFGE